MMLPMREFDWSYEFGMYGGTAAGLLVILAVTGGVFLLLRYLVRRGHL